MMEFLRTLNFQGMFETLGQVVAFVIPLALSWYARNFINSSDRQKRIDVITTLALEAINYAEDCDRRGDRELTFHKLDIPHDLIRTPSPGIQKLCIASSWLVEELQKVGIKRVSMADAMKWVAAEFQKNVGDLRTTHSVAKLTDSAADLLVQLGRAGYITLPTNALQAASLVHSIADWVANQTEEIESDLPGRRMAAMGRLQPSSLMMVSPNGNPSVKSQATMMTPELRLTVLAKQAHEYVSGLQKKGRLRMSDKDTAMAWLIQQVQEEDITVTRDQISEAISLAFDRQRVNNVPATA